MMKTRIPLYAKTLGADLEPPCPTSIPTNVFPHSLWLAFDSIWVCSVGDLSSVQGAVERFDRLTGVRQAYIPFGLNPQAGLGICSGGGFIWACNGAAGEVIKIDPATNQIVSRIAVGAAPRHVCEVGGSVWVTVSGANCVKKIDPCTDQIVATVAVGANPFRMCWGGGNVLWVGCFDSNQVHKIDTDANSISLVITTGIGQPWAQFCDGPRLFVSNYLYATISCYDSSGNYRGCWGLSANSGPHDMVQVRNEMWVTLSNLNQVQCLDMLTGAAVRTINVNQDPASMIFDGDSVWHTCAMANLLVRHPVRETWN